MRDRSGARQELGEFLASRRHQLGPSQVGLSAVGRRRVNGLRREEVSLLSGVSITWYTWLEQGRDVNPSRQVLAAVANTLQLTPAEQRYVFTLGGYPDEANNSKPVLPDRGQAFLNALNPSPAYAITDRWDIVGWNYAYELLYPGVARVDAPDRNLLWLIFTDPSVRNLLNDWAMDSQRFLAQFRADAASRVGTPDFTELIERLQSASPAFCDQWATHSVNSFVSTSRRFEHPACGALVFEQHQLTFADTPQVQVVAYTATDENTGEAFNAHYESNQSTHRLRGH